MIAYDPYVSELEMTAVNVEPVTSLFELLERSDFVSMHAPLNAETTHMLSDAHFGRMKKTALFINNGRGPTVDEEALIRALEAGEIAGAALDVFEVEPVSTNNPLLHMDNVVCTPHIASATSRMAPETRRRLGRELATRIARHVAAQRRQSGGVAEDEPAALAALSADARAESLGTPQRIDQAP